MDAFSFGLVPLALAAVAVVLVLGLWNMLRGGNPNRSQKLMRWRVICQGVALALLAIAFLIGKGG
jgi:hypothetical protein